MVAAVQRRIRRRALVVLLTDLNASALDEGLLAVLPQLSAKHQVLLAAVADPRVERLAAGRADAAQVYDAAAAERARNDRRAIAARLRRSGVDVVDAPTGTVRLKRKVDAEAEMTLDTQSTKTVRVNRPAP